MSLGLGECNFCMMQNLHRSPLEQTGKIGSLAFGKVERSTSVKNPQ